ncbi:hypothetical protein BTH41_03320 [Bacillus mycoides]|nr:hypothetical protein BTH41_03320 [Bacillus mycoides]
MGKRVNFTVALLFHGRMALVEKNKLICIRVSIFVIPL